MGLNIKALDFISSNLEVTDKRICMLGNLYMAKGTAQICKALGTNLAAAYYEDLGATEVIMIDLNGKDGALRINLSKPINNVDLLNSFDILIDGGTSEHVRNQYHCFQNVFNLCKTGALMFHFPPAKGHWGRHGRWSYPMDFFTELARYSGYTVMSVYQEDYVSKLLNTQQDLAFVCLKKESHSVFVSEEIFQEKLIPMLGKRGK